MSKQAFPISINGIVFLPVNQSQSNHEWVKSLAYAHRKELAHCLCAKKPILLCVRHYGSGGPNDHYDLAQWPDTGLDHDQDCKYFNDELDTGSRDQTTLPAFEGIDDDKIRVHLATPLKISTGSLAKRDPSSTNSPTGKSRARASEVALLLRLWREASLNIHDGRSRTWFNATYKLINAAKTFIVNKHGQSLADFLIVGTQERDRMAMAHNETVLDNAGKAGSRLFVIGRLRAYQRAKSRILLPLLDFQGVPKAMVEVALLDRFLDGRNFFKNLLDDRSGNAIVLACIEPNGKDWWKVISVTGIATSKNCVPVESSFELEFEAYLAGNSRRFLKPIAQSENADEGDQRPDFILLDTEPRVRIEVWGMKTECYLADKQKRIEKYKSKGQTLLSWSANPREPFPALPPILMKR